MPIAFNKSKSLESLSSRFSNIAQSFNLTGLSNRWLILICEVVLVILLAQQLAKVTWELIPVETTESNNWKNQAASFQEQDSTSQAYPDLAGLHLFGTPPVPETETANTIDPDSVPRSRLSARITGIVASSIPERSLAIINFRSEDKTYRIGDRLNGANAEVVDIYPDRVIVKNNGQHEALLLYPNNPDQRTAARPTSTPAQPSADIKELSSELRNNPTSIAELISISPVRRDGQLAGYRINPRSRPDLFKAAGLQNNDIALSINGIDLTNNMEAMKLMQELPNLDQISLTIERQGQIYQIDLSS
ncbi:hypothetical protein GZ77_21345 [Endozoicomonas montiporae]|uniref:Type II secretion system protein GspC N-terminal domain-containing protein n=2 Tax=Endozoicomonas montiporae TaxID=1027273 RepID=A0A081N3E8_9GAMM|nr:type II secretion system protein GspC [Endozoicomonas montiporae]AMO58276.1 general secretion pathway protein C [Endozoicomonas montiporae CL-33]KEQ12971.1 hypothetical protein GZ77_21345 [Endozoicomonas montiporae]